MFPKPKEIHIDGNGCATTTCQPTCPVMTALPETFVTFLLLIVVTVSACTNDYCAYDFRCTLSLPTAMIVMPAQMTVVTAKQDVNTAVLWCWWFCQDYLWCFNWLLFLPRLIAHVCSHLQMYSAMMVIIDAPRLYNWQLLWGYRSLFLQTCYL